MSSVIQTLNCSNQESQPKKKRADGQMSGLAGEFFVAAELLKRGLQTSVTFGNAKAIDLIAYSEDLDRNFNIQVKTVRSKNWFLISREKVKRTHIYVFVVLNKPGVPVDYFIVLGVALLENEIFAKGFADPKMPGVYPTTLESYRNNWFLFEAPTPAFTV